MIFRNTSASCSSRARLPFTVDDLDAAVDELVDESDGAVVEAFMDGADFDAVLTMFDDLDGVVDDLDGVVDGVVDELESNSCFSHRPTSRSSAKYTTLFTR